MIVGNQAAPATYVSWLKYLKVYLTCVGTYPHIDDSISESGGTAGYGTPSDHTPTLEQDQGHLPQISPSPDLTLGLPLTYLTSHETDKIWFLVSK